MSENAQKISETFQIGDLAKRTGKTARALRMYEDMGLLSPSTRSAGGFRLYDASSIDRVAWIESLKALGFSLPDVCDLVVATKTFPLPKAAMAEIRGRFHLRLSQVEQQLETLSALKEELHQAVDYLDGCVPCNVTADQNLPCSSCGTQAKSPPRLVQEVTLAATEQLRAASSSERATPVSTNGASQSGHTTPSGEAS